MFQIFNLRNEENVFPDDKMLEVSEILSLDVIKKHRHEFVWFQMIKHLVAYSSEFDQSPEIHEFRSR